MQVAFFDLDRTLLDCNSGHLWLREEWRIGRLGWRQLGEAAWFLGRYALGDDRLETALHRVARPYAGVPEAHLCSQVEAWFERTVVRRARPGALAALAAHKQAGHTAVLATSSGQHAAACAARAWGFDDTLCTTLEVDDGVLTGRFARLAFGRHKLDLCGAWAAERGVALADCTFYTDSYSDLPLLEAVGRPVVVAPDRRLARVARARGWEVVDWGVAT